MARFRSPTAQEERVCHSLLIREWPEAMRKRETLAPLRFKKKFQLHTPIWQRVRQGSMAGKAAENQNRVGKFRIMGLLVAVAHDFWNLLLHPASEHPDAEEQQQDRSMTFVSCLWDFESHLFPHELTTIVNAYGQSLQVLQPAMANACGNQDARLDGPLVYPSGSQTWVFRYSH